MKAKLLILAILAIIIIAFVACSSIKDSENTIKPTPKVELSYTEPTLMYYGNIFQGRAWAEGLVQNIGEIDAYDVKAEVTFYDDNGAILDKRHAYLNRLAIGESWSYAVDYMGGITTKLTSASVIVSCE